MKNNIFSKAQTGYKDFIPSKGWSFGSINNKDKTKMALIICKHVIEYSRNSRKINY